MSSHPSTSTAPAPGAIAGWKIACGIGAAIVFLPVAGLALGMFLLSALPIIPFLVPMVVAFLRSGGHHAPPAAPARPLLTPQRQGGYRLAHGSA
jgi:hypothetical protein